MDYRVFSSAKCVGFYDCNQSGELALWSYMAWCGEIGGLHLDVRGITREAMLREGHVFLLSQLSYEMFKPAKYGENCILKTWESAISGVKFIRSYSLENESGEILCRSTSSWILVDPENRKILRPKEYRHEFLLTGDDVYPKLSRLKMPEYEKTAEHITVYSELDENHHLNNSYYGRLLIDYAPAGFIGKPVKKAEIQFINEARLNDIINIHTAITGENSYAMYGTFNDGRKCFEAVAQVAD